MNLKETEQLCKKLMADHGIGHWKFIWMDSGVCFGRCYYAARAIGLSMQLCQANEFSQVKDTILHEIAHALAGHKAGHGALWKMVARRIGASDDRCFSFGEGVKPPQTGGYIGTCKCKVSRHWKRNKPAERGWLCNQCRNIIHYKKQ